MNLHVSREAVQIALLAYFIIGMAVSLVLLVGGKHILKQLAGLVALAVIIYLAALIIDLFI